MPTGIYIRTEEQLRQLRENAKKARKVAHSLPRTQKQIEAGRKNFIKAQKVGRILPRTSKQLKGKVFADDIIEHHNDLCHGAEDPDDVTYMIHREHSSLHMKLRVENGTHNLLSKNRIKKRE